MREIKNKNEYRMTYRWKNGLPSEEFELTANSLSAHIETHEKLFSRIFN